MSDTSPTLACPSKLQSREGAPGPGPRTVSCFHTIIHKKPMMIEVDRSVDSCAIDLQVRLPRELADEVREVQERDPEALSRILVYGLTRRAIYRQLSRSGEVAAQKRHA